MNEDRSFAINKKSFIISVAIIFGLIIAAYLMTQFVPQGSFAYNEVDGSKEIVPGTYSVLDQQQHYPVWKIITAPFEVFASEYAAMVIVIMVFILLIGGSFTVMDESGLLKAIISKIALKSYSRKYMLIPILALIFMVLGAFFGILEEIVPLIPLVVGLCYMLGWDSLMGLGLSLLATCCGFSAAIMNPFTVAIAQRIAGLPLYSGTGLRIFFFIIIYTIVVLFLTSYARKIDKDPLKSQVFEEDTQRRKKYNMTISEIEKNAMFNRSAIIFCVVCFIVLLAFLFSASALNLTDYSMPLIALIFIVMSTVSARLSGMSGKKVLKTFFKGIGAIAPSIILIPLAISVTYIIQDSKILDTIINGASGLFANTKPFRQHHYYLWGCTGHEFLYRIGQR